MEDPRAIRSNDDAPVTDALLMRTWNDGEANVIRQLLATYDIPCQVVSDIPHAVLPLSVDGLGEIRILVSSQHVDEAATLIAEHMRQGLEVLPGGRAGSDEGRETA